MIQEFSTVVSNLGFPIFVAGFMLLKQSKDTEQMQAALNSLKDAIDSLVATNKGE